MAAFDKCELHKVTLELVTNRPAWLTFKLIGEETGLHPAWIEAFAYERSDDPGVNRVVRLYEYLTKTTLTVTNVCQHSRRIETA